MFLSFLGLVFRMRTSVFQFWDKCFQAFHDKCFKVFIKLFFLVKGPVFLSIRTIFQSFEVLGQVFGQVFFKFEDKCF